MILWPCRELAWEDAALLSSMVFRCSTHGRLFPAISCHLTGDVIFIGSKERQGRVGQVHYQDNLGVSQGNKNKNYTSIAWTSLGTLPLMRVVRGFSSMPSHGTSGNDGVPCCGHRISGTHSLQSSQQEERQILAQTCLCLNRIPVISTSRTLSQVSHESPAASSTRKCMPLCACHLY